MNKTQAASEIISHALPLVPFQGWNLQTLAQAAIAAGYKRTDVIRVFPGGAIEAVDAFLRELDNSMLEALQGYSLGTMKIRERITTCIRVKLELMETHREAVRKALALHATPFYAHRALGSLYRTVDAIWYVAGDNSTDFNFYTKRLILAGVYSSTLLVWLDDKSLGHAQTWEFLDRRIANVMQFEKVKHQLKSWLALKTG